MPGIASVEASCSQGHTLVPLFGVTLLRHSSLPIAMVTRLAVIAALLLLAGPGPRPPPCVDAAPWDGIVGFLRAVSALQDRRHEPE